MEKWQGRGSSELVGWVRYLLTLPAQRQISKEGNAKALVITRCRESAVYYQYLARNDFVGHLQNVS